ncbi:ribonuclease E/G [Hyphobacterium indicum]|uniref:ribonuclease E/G n=1 Tax=Hyphobacterium indicum TaxID=2162714 RepID=UPI000D6527D6|nr:ribonuclease E/G [Hyphobacterium indicum]
MNRQIAVEEWVGETRAAIVENGQIVELHFDRWSEQGQRAFAGELFLARVRKVEGALNAAFVDLGRGEPGFLPFGKAGRPSGLHEGAAIPVRVTREAFAEKGPTLTLAERDVSGDAPQLIEADANLAERLLRRYPEAEAIWADEAGIDISAAIEAAMTSRIPIPGGGVLIIEPTSALTAIDIDSAGRTAKAGRKLALDLNVAAMPEIARQLRLRGIGGNVVVDCLHLRAQPDRKAVEGALKRALKADPARIDVLPMSPFGLIELVRQRTGRSIAEVINDGQTGLASAETLALTALRGLEKEAMANRATQLVLRTSAKIALWLEADSIGWRAAMTDRIGPRFALESRQDVPRDFMEVVAAR